MSRPMGLAFSAFLVLSSVRARVRVVNTSYLRHSTVEFGVESLSARWAAGERLAHVHYGRIQAGGGGARGLRGGQRAGRRKVKRGSSQARAYEGRAAGACLGR